MAEGKTPNGNKVTVQPDKAGYVISVRDINAITTIHLGETNTVQMDPSRKGSLDGAFCPVGVKTPINETTAHRLRELAKPLVEKNIQPLHAEQIAMIVQSASCPMGAASKPSKPIKPREGKQPG